MRSIANYIPILKNSFNRDEWVKKILISLPETTKILDAGAGECRYKKYCGHLNYLSQDFSKYDGKGDKKGLQTRKWDYSEIDIKSDITKIPVKNASFDAILCTEVLEHVPYPDRAIKEFSRILRKGGILILTAPFASQTHFSPFHYSTGFNIYWYRYVLNDYRFNIKSFERNGNFFDYLAQEIIRIPFVVKKYSDMGILSFILLPFVFPIALFVLLTGFLTNNSEESMCFGYHVLAIKK